MTLAVTAARKARPSHCRCPLTWNIVFYKNAFCEVLEIRIRGCHLIGLVGKLILCVNIYKYGINLFIHCGNKHLSLA